MISPETIALVRERTDIVALIQESVPSLKRRGRTFVGLCPFHKEKSPSFHVNPDRGFFHCFGCKESGSAIDFLMKMEGHTFPEAVRDLAERSGVEIAEDFRKPQEVDRQKKLKDDLYAVNQMAAVWFEKQLREHPQRSYALDELDKRGLRPSWAHRMAVDASHEVDDRELPGFDNGPDAESSFTEIDDTLQAFRIGYAPGGWDGLASYLKTQGISPIAAEQVGLLVPRSSGTGHYDRFRHRLMFAVVDPQGRVVAFSGRALAPLPEEAGKPQAEKPAKYINSPESPIYTKGNMLFGIYQARHAIRDEQTALLVEGNFDVVSLHARGLKNVVAPLGTAFTTEQAKLLKRFATSAVLLFDGDLAGKKATRASRGPLKEAGIAARVASLPEGVDPDELARTKGIDTLTELVGRARGMLEFLIEEALDASFTAADAFERAARVGEVAKLLAEEDDPLVRSMTKAYADQLSARLDLHGLRTMRDDQRSSEPFRALEASVKKALAAAGPRPQGGVGPERARIAPRAPGSAQRKNMVGTLVEHPEMIWDPEIERELGLLEGPSARVVAALRDSFTTEVVGERSGSEDSAEEPVRRARLDTGRLLAQLEPALATFVSERLASPELASLEEARSVFLENADRLRRLILSQETDELAREQTKAEGDWEASMSLAAEAAERAKRRHQGPR